MTDDLEAVGPIITRALTSVLESQTAAVETAKTMLDLIDKSHVGLEVCLAMIGRLGEVLIEITEADRPDLTKRVSDSLLMAAEVLDRDNG